MIEEMGLQTFPKGSQWWRQCDILWQSVPQLLEKPNRYQSTSKYLRWRKMCQRHITAKTVSKLGQAVTATANAANRFTFRQ